MVAVSLPFVYLPLRLLRADPVQFLWDLCDKLITFAIGLCDALVRQRAPLLLDFGAVLPPFAFYLYVLEQSPCHPQKAAKTMRWRKTRCAGWQDSQASVQFFQYSSAASV